MAQKNVANKLRVVGENSPNSLGLDLQIQKSLAKAKTREFAILQHENMETHKNIKPVIRARFLIPTIVELAIGQRQRYAPIWNIPEKDTNFEKFQLAGLDSPESWLVGDSRILYNMCISGEVPVRVFMNMNDSKSFATLVIDIVVLQQKFQKE